MLTLCIYCQGSKIYKANGYTNQCGFCNGTGLDQGANWEITFRERELRLYPEKKQGLEILGLYVFVVASFLFCAIEAFKGVTNG